MDQGPEARRTPLLNNARVICRKKPSSKATKKEPSHYLCSFGVNVTDKLRDLKRRNCMKVLSRNPVSGSGQFEFLGC